MPRSLPARRTPGRPREDERADVRTALLDTARRLFGQRGYADVSIRELAAEADVTPAMVHYYFGGKQGLFEAMLEDAVGRLLGRLREVVAEGLGDPRAIERVVAVMVETFRREPWIPSLVVREVLLEPGRFRDRFVALYARHVAELLPRLISSEIEARKFRPDLDPRLAFVSLFGMTLFPFVARPVLERALGLHFDPAFLSGFADHTARLFLQGAREART